MLKGHRETEPLVRSEAANHRYCGLSVTIPVQLYDGDIHQFTGYITHVYHFMDIAAYGIVLHPTNTVHQIGYQELDNALMFYN